MSSRGARVARGFAAAGSATLVAALFHMVGGGDAPSALALALSLVFSSLVCIALSGRRIARWRVTLSVLVSQFFFHVLFTLTPSAALAGVPASGHLHGGVQLTFVPGAAASVTVPASGLAADLALWLAHLVAAVLTIAVLYRGERAFWAVCSFGCVRPRLRADQIAHTLPVQPRVLHPVVESPPLIVFMIDVVLGGLRHRGPPRVADTHISSASLRRIVLLCTGSAALFTRPQCGRETG